MSTSDDWIARRNSVSCVCAQWLVLSLLKEGTDSNSDISGKSELESELDPKTIGGCWVLGLGVLSTEGEPQAETSMVGTCCDHGPPALASCWFGPL